MNYIQSLIERVMGPNKLKIKNTNFDINSDTAVIYTDLLLDDLCALDYLSHKYKRALVIAVNTADLPTSNYTLDNFDLTKAEDLLQKMFNGQVHIITTPIGKVQDIKFNKNSRFDVYCLSNATYIMEDLVLIENNIKNLYTMIGMDHSVNPEDTEWNASQDLQAYVKLCNYIKEHSGYCQQISFKDCETLYKKYNYGSYTSTCLLNKYIAQMEKIKDSTVCFDLQCVLSKFEYNKENDTCL